MFSQIRRMFGGHSATEKLKAVNQVLEGIDSKVKGVATKVELTAAQQGRLGKLVERLAEVESKNLGVHDDSSASHEERSDPGLK